MKRTPTAAVAVGLSVALAGCSFATLKPQNVSQGAEVTHPGLDVGNLALVSDGTTAHVVGTVLSSDGDTLTGVGVQGASDQGAATTQTDVSTPAGTPTVLDAKKLSVSAANITTGSNVTLVLTFSKAGQITAQVPVFSSSGAIWAPSPSASTAG